MCDNPKLQFYQSYMNLDIWFAQNTKSGTTKYQFYFMGKTYEADTHDQIISMARMCVDNHYQKIRGGK